VVAHGRAERGAPDREVPLRQEIDDREGEEREGGDEVGGDGDEPVAAAEVADVAAAAQRGAEADHPVEGEPGEDRVRDLVLERDQKSAERAAPENEQMDQEITSQPGQERIRRRRISGDDLDHARQRDRQPGQQQHARQRHRPLQPTQNPVQPRTHVGDRLPISILSDIRRIFHVGDRLPISILSDIRRIFA
jgi:hypothetical protein